MGFRCGIVGLPNVGKSTLFNALTMTAQAAAENYPFCTIEPNVGQVPVPDPRLERLAAISKSARIVPTFLTFVDIAGLVRGASKGEGLGNQFLGHIREVDAILHVVRCFEDENVTHVEARIDPVADIETVTTELMLADLDSLERRIAVEVKRARGQDKEAKAKLALMERAAALLRDGRPARLLERSAEEEPALRELGLLTTKPILYVCNVDEGAAATGNDHSRAVEAMARSEDAGAVVLSVAAEAEIAELDEAEERRAFLETLGLDEPALHKVIREGYQLLGLITFFTTGPKETRAWTVPRGSKAPTAAGQIHSDFEAGFIRAETISCDDFVSLGGEQQAREAGKLRVEGRDYVVEDGDVLHIRFAV